MKRAIPTLLIGTILGIAGTMLALPALERSRERRIVQEAIANFGLPAVPPEARVTYAYHNDQFLLEWYGFEIQTTSEQAKRWKAEADELNSKKQLGAGSVEFDCELRNSYNIEVRLFESHK